MRPERASRGLQRQAARVALLAALLVCLPGCRLDMHIQPKYLPLAKTDFFGDGRSERPVVEGTVARGHLRLDEQLYTGKVNGQLATTFPFPITQADLERGRERFTIYCAPCHDVSGTGRGMIVQRGFPAPPSYHIQRLRDAPVGHLFDVITNGLGNMYPYASRVTPEDRWRIVAYIRALQLSQFAKIEDVPGAEREKLQGPEK
ncbi:MAG TPA: cytochrome c [Candidatus Acidoferrales bacterium]|nr:cytochrome c [Candidatus Acidoferrales bacterium]